MLILLTLDCLVICLLLSIREVAILVKRGFIIISLWSHCLLSTLTVSTIVH